MSHSRKLKPLSDSSDESAVGEQVWCICRKPADGKFMIGCDGCDEWYHGACINISESKSENIIKFYCKKCRRRNPDLETVFKRGPERERSHDKRSHERRKRHRVDDELERQRRKKIKKRREEIIPNLSDDEEEDKKEGEKVRPIVKPPPKPEEEKKASKETVVLAERPETKSESLEVREKVVKDSSTSSSKPSQQSCGMCRGCKVKENCGLCDVCIDNIGCPDFIGQCEDRVCLGPSKASSIVQQKPLRRLRVVSSDPDDSDSAAPAPSVVAPVPSKIRSTAQPPATARLHGSTGGGRDAATVESSSSCSSLSDDLSELEEMPRNKKRPVSTNRKEVKLKHRRPTPVTNSGERVRSGSRAGPVVQCQGPDCVQTARPGSKYCSDNCGVALATRRIYEFLPTRLSNWSSSQCVAEERNKKQLAGVREESLRVRERLMDMEREHLKLTHLVERSYHMQADDEDETADGDDQELLEQIVCVTCASEVNLRLALRHMEKCFQKMESNTVFYASYKEQLVGTPLFCDTYDPQMKAYCKRLKVLCEHTKDPKLLPNAVCGFPLIENVFDETGEFCKTAKRKCTRHLGWERLRRAKIDVERYRQLIRMDELVLEERQLRSCLTGRAGVLGLMLHQTVDHDPGHPIIVTPSPNTSASKKKEPPTPNNDIHSPPVLLGRPATNFSSAAVK